MMKAAKFWLLIGMMLCLGCGSTSSRRIGSIEAPRTPAESGTQPPLPDSTGELKTASTSNERRKSQTRNDKASVQLVGGESTPVASASLKLTLSEALATGLTQNPDLIAVRGTETVSEAVQGVAGTYPWNPFVQAQYFPNGKPFIPGTGPGDGAGQSNYYVWLMQRFELGRQMRHRKESASAALNQVRWNIHQAELMNLAQTERLYFAAVYQHQVRDLAHQAADLNQRLLEIVERRFEAGLATTAETTTARVTLRQARRQAHLAEATFQSALLTLRQQMNIPLSCPVELPDDLTRYEWHAASNADRASSELMAVSDCEDLAAELVEGRPDVLAARSAVDVAQANAGLARAAKIPDLQAGPIYETADDGTKFIGLRLQTDLPIINTGEPLARQRRAELQQQMLVYNQLRARATIEAQSAIDRYERARKLAEEARIDFSDAMPKELQDMTTQFEAGQADILNVLATQNNLIQDRRTYLDLLNELAQSAANVTQATGLPPERLISIRERESNSQQ